MKEETIEEAAVKYAHKELNNELTSKVGNFYGFSSSFIEGAMWQKEQQRLQTEANIAVHEEWYKNLPEGSPIYTEEEVLDLFKSYTSDNQFKMNVALLSPEFWFNENKKK